VTTDKKWPAGSRHITLGCSGVRVVPPPPPRPRRTVRGGHGVLSSPPRSAPCPPAEMLGHSGSWADV